jgi:hypothetical protein
MPVFDRSAVQSARVDADFLRGVLGPAKRGSTSFQQASREYRRRQQRATGARALIVIVLLGSFCGSAVVMSETPRLPSDAGPILRNASSRAPYLACALKTASGPFEDVTERP